MYACHFLVRQFIAPALRLALHAPVTSLLSSCFATGARDGTGRLWQYRRGEWRSTILPACQLGEASLTGDNQSSKWKRQVTMVSLIVG